jgi:hypothetical protein
VENIDRNPRMLGNAVSQKADENAISRSELTRTIGAPMAGCVSSASQHKAERTVKTETFQADPPRQYVVCRIVMENNQSTPGFISQPLLITMSGRGRVAEHASRRTKPKHSLQFFPYMPSYVSEGRL